MALKRWQCWALWIVIDLLYVGFFAFQEYWLTAGRHIDRPGRARPTLMTRRAEQRSMR